MIGVLIFIIAIYLLYKWSTATFDYFEKKGVPYNKPWPLVGSRLGLFLRNSTAVDFIQLIYNEFKDEKVSGMFEFRYPSYVIRDPEIIKKLAVKEFESFSEHREMIATDNDPILAKALFFMKGQDWKDMRSTMSPAFTGSKMRLMYSLMNKVGTRMTNAIEEQIKNGGSNRFEFKDLARKCAVDVIATTAFGIEIDSYKNPENEFMVNTSKAVDFTKFSVALKFAGFMATILDTMKYRQEKNIVRHDFIELMMQVKKGTLSHDNENDANDGFATVEEHEVTSKSKRQWDDSYLVSQSFGFFFAGFETISTAMTFMAYELIRNPDIQKKLQEEIDEVHQRLNGKELTYEELQKMKYLDQVVSETLRMWPPAPVVDRLCVKDYTLEYDDKKIEIEAGRNFYLLIYGIHHDERYFPNPEKFDPERFSDENKDKINRDAYMPFGVGPRNCVGSRFALMEIKEIFFSFLLRFNLVATEETQIPIKLAKNQVMFTVVKGLNLAFEPRKN